MIKEPLKSVASNRDVQQYRDYLKTEFEEQGQKLLKDNRVYQEQMMQAAKRYWKENNVHNIFVTPGGAQRNGNVQQDSCYHWMKCHYIEEKYNRIADNEDLFKAERGQRWFYGNQDDLIFLHPCPACQRITLRLADEKSQPMDFLDQLTETTNLGIPKYIRQLRIRNEAQRRKKISTGTGASMTRRNIADAENDPPGKDSF